MEKFITFRETSDQGELGYFILQREFPHYIGRLVSQPLKNTLCQVPIAGYDLWVAFNFTLQGRMIPAKKEVLSEVQVVLEKMAHWYLDKRITPNEKKYLKFKLNVSGSL